MFGVTYQAAPRLYILILCSIIIISLLPVVQVIIAREIINTAINVVNGALATTRLYQLIAVSLFLAITQSLANAGKDYANQLLSSVLALNLTQDILEKAATMPLAFFEEPDNQDMLERANQNPAGHISLFILSSQNVLAKGVQIVSLGVVLIVLAPFLTLALAGLFLPYVWFRWDYSRKLYSKEYDRATKRRWTRYFVSLLTSRHNVPEVKILTLAPFLISKYLRIASEFVAEDKRLFQRDFLGRVVFALISSLALGGMLFSIVNKVVSGSLTVGDIALFSAASIRLKEIVESSIKALGTSWQQVMHVSDTTSFLQANSEAKQNSTRHIQHLRGILRFEAVSFGYPSSSETVLKEVSFEVYPGETLAIVGSNGAGKSTIVNLLARLYVPSKGIITHDGVDIQAYSLESYYKHLSVVSQTFNTYEGTASENISYGNWPALVGNEQAIADIVEQAHMEDLITGMPQGYETQLGRMFGTYDLSRGQWQKLAILRALAHESDVLILDEPTASLDVETEYQLYERFSAIAADRTTILISHRLSTIQMADRILVLHKGQIVEIGTHNQLRDQPGSYYAQMLNMHASQMGLQGD